MMICNICGEEKAGAEYTYTAEINWSDGRKFDVYVEVALSRNYKEQPEEFERLLPICRDCQEDLAKKLGVDLSKLS